VNGENRPPLSNIPALRGVTIPDRLDKSFMLTLAKALNDLTARINALSQSDRDRAGAPVFGTAGTPTTVDGDAEAGRGRGPAKANWDHQHDLDTSGTPGLVGLVSTQGSGPGSALVDHTHALTNLNLVSGTQADLAARFAAQTSLGLYRHSNMQIHIPSATTGDGGIFLALADGGFIYVLPVDDEGFCSIDAYDETYSAGTFNRVDGSAAAGNTMGFARATHVFLAGFGRPIVMGSEGAHDAIFATNATERIRVDGTTGAAKFAHNLVVTPRTPAQITGNVNDYDPGGNQGFVRLSSDAAWNITGLLAAPDGTHRTLVNVGGFNLTLKNADGASTAANQFLNAAGGDVVLGPNHMAVAVYDGTTQRWRVGKLA
jgi:hypothetical protein